MSRCSGIPLFFIVILCCSVFAMHSHAQDLQPGTTFRDCPDCPEMVVIPAGHFLMGSSEADTERDLAAVPRSDLGPLKWILATPEGTSEMPWPGNTRSILLSSPEISV
jgi:hypothetical protein